MTDQPETETPALPEIPEEITFDFVREEIERGRDFMATVEAFMADQAAWRAHVDEALHRLSPLPARLDEMDGAKMCARAAAQTFAHLDSDLRQKVDEAHEKVAGIVGADGGLILSSEQPLTAEAVAAVAAQVTAATAAPLEPLDSIQAD